MRNLPYHEGDWFAGPLGDDGFAAGLIARMASRAAPDLFPTREAAITAARSLEAEGYAIKVHDSRDMDAGWLTLASHAARTTNEEQDQEYAHMAEGAATGGGHSDGHERDSRYGAD